MAEPIAVGSLILSGAKVLSSLFGGDSPRDKAIKELERIMKQGLDPRILQRLIRTIAAREQQAQSGILARARAGNLDPSSGLVQEMIGASRRGAAAQEGDLREAFNDESERVKRAAASQLAGMPADTSTGDLIGSTIELLDTYLNSRKNKSTTGTPADLVAPRARMLDEPMIGGSITPSPSLRQPVRADAGMKIYSPSDFYDDTLAPDIRDLDRLQRVSPLNYRRIRLPRQSRQPLLY